MQKFVVMLSGFVLLSLVAPASAKTVYDCTIQQYFDLDVNMNNGNVASAIDGPLVRGKLNGPETSGTKEFIANFYAKGIVGRGFKVDTRDGLITGFDPLNNDLAEKRIVILDGGDGQSFILLSIWGPIVASRYMEIKTFAISDEKPFVVIADGNVFSGKCK